MVCSFLCIVRSRHNFESCQKEFLDDLHTYRHDWFQKLLQAARLWYYLSHPDLAGLLRVQLIPDLAVALQGAILLTHVKACCLAQCPPLTAARTSALCQSGFGTGQTGYIKQLLQTARKLLPR